MRREHLREWRDAAKQVVRAYKAWCAANCGDRQALYISFVDALGREEQAAKQVEQDASAPAAGRSSSHAQASTAARTVG